MEILGVDLMALGPVLLLVAVALLSVDVALSSLLYRAQRRHARKSADDYDKFQHQWDKDRDTLYITLLKLEQSITQVQSRLQISETPQPQAPYIPPPGHLFGKGVAERLRSSPEHVIYGIDYGTDHGASGPKSYESFAEVTAARLAREAREQTTAEELEDGTDKTAHVGHA